METSLFFLILFTQLAFSMPIESDSWSQLSVFYKSSSLDLSEMYTDPSTHHTHLVSNEFEGTISYYMRIENGVLAKLIKIPDIDKDGMPKIKGQNDGKHIFMIYTSKLGKIMFTESSDNGNTWTTPISISVANQRCYSFHLDYIHETGRLFSVFRSGNNKIMFTTRQQGSSVFSNPILIADTYTISHPYACYSIDQGKIILHVAYSERKTMVYTKSTDNGASWLTPHDIGIKLEHADSAYTIFMSDPKISNSIFIFYDKDFTLMQEGMAYSNDHGNSWSTPILFRSYARDEGIAICGNTQKKYLALASVGQGLMLWTDWEQNNMKSENIPDPFNRHERLITCDNSEVEIIGS